MRLPAAVLPEEFACHAKACAPPPVGSGGSKAKGGGRSAAAQADHEANIDYLYRVGRLPSEYYRHKVITKGQARGDSRPVSFSEFQRLADVGRAQLDKFEAKKSPIKGLDDDWDRIRVNAYNEVQKSWGGATIDSHTGVPLPQGANLYAITVKGGQSSVSVPENASRAEFARAMDEAKERFRPILERQSHYLGVFHDDENKRIDIDPVLVVRNRADVDTIGAASHSIGGAYNFSDGNGYWPPHVGEG